MDFTSVTVVGFGSHHGFDRVGWEVVSRLQDFPPGSIRMTDDPLAVLDIASECQLLIAVDAMIGTGLRGTIHRFDWPDPRLLFTRGVSSHGVGLVEALQLSDALGKLPRRVVVFAIEIGQQEADWAAMEAAIRTVVTMIVNETTMETARMP